jgi:alpha-glucosidase
MTMESIKGMEFITFDQNIANEEPAHAVTIPYTRNLFDPMDFTPMVLDKIPNIKRRTTSVFELATSVVFLSGIQHMAEIPEGMKQVPDYVQNFLRHLPVVWEDVRFIDGYPGKSVVLARRSGNTWVVAGLNGEDKLKDFTLDLSFISGVKGNIITDGNENLSFVQNNIQAGKENKVGVKPNGGFVMVFNTVKK